MTTYILKRLLLIPPMVFGITLVSFCVIQMAPGTGGAVGEGDVAGGKLTRQQLKVLRDTFHYGEHVVVRYFYWLGVIQPPYRPQNLTVQLPVSVDERALPGEYELTFRLTFRGARRLQPRESELENWPKDKVKPDTKGVFPRAETTFKVRLVVDSETARQELPRDFKPELPPASFVPEAGPFGYAAAFDQPRVAPGQTATLWVRLSGEDDHFILTEGSDASELSPVGSEAARMHAGSARIPSAPWRGLLFGDFGQSVTRPSISVASKLIEPICVTVAINLVVVFIIYCASIPIGIYSATHQNTFLDRSSTAGLFILYSLPSFWVAILLIKWMVSLPEDSWFRLPFQGLYPPGAESMSTLELLYQMTRRLYLPVMVQCYAGLATLSRFMRVGMIDIIRSDFIRTARAKGCGEGRVIYRHALRNSLIPIVTILAGLLPGLIGGSVIVETIFGIPGMGYLGYTAVLERDYTILMATLTISAVLTLMGILMSDLMYVIVDPRISFEKGGR